MPMELPDARQLSDEALQVLRLRALRGIELGYSELELSELLGVCHETISRWWTVYRADGPRALPGGRSGRPLGSGRLLSDRQAERIKARIDFHSPEELGIPHALWTRRAVRDLIRRECGVDLAERTVGLYLRRWGYTSKRPARRAGDDRSGATSTNSLPPATYIDRGVVNCQKEMPKGFSASVIICA